MELRRCLSEIPLALAVCCALGAAGNAAVAEPQHADSGIALANARLGLKLLTELVGEQPDQNVVISPPSIALALAMTYNGANGETRQAMAKALELEGMSLDTVNADHEELMKRLEQSDEGVQLEIANSLWAHLDLELKPEFIERCKRFYAAELERLDLRTPEAIDVINHWVNDRTKGKIPEIVDEFDQEAVLALINAIYFKGRWRVAFNPTETKEGEFTLLDGSKVPLPMMSRLGKLMSYEGNGFQAVRLPYSGGQISLLAFVPSVDSSVEEFLGQLTVDNWQKWMSQFRQQDTFVRLPRFRLEYGMQLNAALKALGMGIAFTNGADFSNLCTGPAQIDEVIHKTFLEVNEEGTEAAGATAVKMKRGRLVRVIAERPFFCAIHDATTDTILFMGTVVDPE